MWGTDNSNVKGNNVTGSGYGLWFQNGDEYSNNVITENYFNNTNDFNVVSMSGSNNTVNKNYWSNYDGWDNTGDGYGDTDVPFVIISGYFEDTSPVATNVDIYPPSITVISPENISYITESSAVDTIDLGINMTASDNVSGLDVCLWSIDGGSNTTYSAPLEVILTTEGVHYTDFYCNDTAENWGHQRTYFTLTYLTTLQEYPILAVIPVVISLALIAYLGIGMLSGSGIDVRKIIVAGIMILVAIAMIGVMYAV
jgi:hypothetical protein